MEDVIVKIVDMENEVNADIDKLVDLKQEIMRTINAVENPEYHTLLELRYLCFKAGRKSRLRWDIQEGILYRMRDEALQKIKVPAKNFLMLST